MVEHVVYGGEELAQSSLSIINGIFKNGVVPDTLKMGFLRLSLKNKGSRLGAKYYRGITVLLVLCKLMFSIIKARIVQQLDSTPSSLQRLFKRFILTDRIQIKFLCICSVHKQILKKCCCFFNRIRFKDILPYYINQM